MLKILFITRTVKVDKAFIINYAHKLTLFHKKYLHFKLLIKDIYFAHKIFPKKSLLIYIIYKINNIDTIN